MAKDFFYDHKILETKFSKGELDHVQKYLFSFVTEHRDEIRQIAHESQDKEALVNATRTLIEKRGSVHLPSEMAEQIKEINREIWYQGEKGNQDKSQISEEWNQQYSLKWREGRKIELLFLINKNRESIFDLLKY
jgi:hypothetical protein